MLPKTCRKCNVAKPANKEHFYAMSATVDGVRPSCKICDRPDNTARRGWAREDVKQQRRNKKREREGQRRRRDAPPKRAKVHLQPPLFVLGLVAKHHHGESPARASLELPDPEARQELLELAEPQEQQEQ